MKKNEMGYVLGDLFPDYPKAEKKAQKKAAPKKDELLAENAKLQAEISKLQAENAELFNTRAALQAENAKLQNKAQAYDELLTSASLFPTNVVAKSFGWSAIALNKYLQQKGIQYKHGDVWVLYQRYANRGYTRIMWYGYAQDSYGRELSKAHTYWTMKGIAFIRDLLKKDGQIKE